MVFSLTSTVIRCFCDWRSARPMMPGPLVQELEHNFVNGRNGCLQSLAKTLRAAGLEKIILAPFAQQFASNRIVHAEPSDWKDICDETSLVEAQRSAFPPARVRRVGQQTLRTIALH